MEFSQEHLTLEERNKEISEYITNIRKFAGTTTEVLAEKLCVDTELLERLESGDVQVWYKKEGNTQDLKVFLDSFKRIALSIWRSKHVL